MAIKSPIIGVRVDTAGAAHNCQGNSRHRVTKGDVRLKVRNGRGWDHYCQVCADAIIARDIAKLAVLKEMTPTRDDEDDLGQ
jgi:hypothetical protein